eukprot:2286007-Amphidinium_carterae.1
MEFVSKSSTTNDNNRLFRYNQQTNQPTKTEANKQESNNYTNSDASKNQQQQQEQKEDQEQEQPFCSFYGRTCELRIGMLF